MCSSATAAVLTIIMIIVVAVLAVTKISIMVFDSIVQVIVIHYSQKETP